MLPLEQQPSSVFEPDCYSQHSDSFPENIERAPATQHSMQQMTMESKMTEAKKDKPKKKRVRNTIKHPKFKVSWTPDEVSQFYYLHD